MWKTWDFFCLQLLFLATVVDSERSDMRFLLTDNAGGGYASSLSVGWNLHNCVCVCCWLYLESFRSKIEAFWKKLEGMSVSCFFVDFL